MITLQRTGTYRLVETKSNTKVLYLDTIAYAWINAKDIGEILVFSTDRHVINEVLSTGAYKIYHVVNEPDLTDLQHLELEAGEGIWQSYLLLTGLPSRARKRVRIVPSKDHITGHKDYADQTVTETRKTATNQTARRGNEYGRGGAI